MNAPTPSARLTRDDLQRLAGRYADDAELLLRHQRWASAYYLAGYAVECALKACIANQVRQHDFPDLKFVRQLHNHDPGQLAKLAGLHTALEARCEENENFRNYRHQAILKWSSASRYEDKTQAMAEDIVRAVGDTEDGVLTWLKKHWGSTRSN
jgi:HEPN domain-containing protein